MVRPTLRFLFLLVFSSFVSRVHSQQGVVLRQDGNPDVVRREYYVPNDRGGPIHGQARVRRGGPFEGVFPGLIATVASSWLLWFNEGRCVRDARMHRKAESSVVELAEWEEIDPANDGSLVHVVGQIETKEGIMDQTFGLHRNEALRLKRTTEAYQWTEERRESRTRAGERETRVEVTYYYQKKWGARPVESHRFEAPAGHENPPPKFALGRETQTVEDATLPNGLNVPPELLNELGGFRKVGLGRDSDLPYDEAAVIAGNTLYFSDQAAEIPLQEEVSTGEIPSSEGGASGDGRHNTGRIAVARAVPKPAVGDTRVAWEEVTAPRRGISVLAEQRDGKVVPWLDDSTGHSIYQLVEGEVPAKDMILDLQEQSKFLTDILRAVGWVGNFVGLNLLLSCIPAIVARFPLGLGSFLEPLVGVATSFVAVGASTGLSAAVFAAAWLRFRPILALGLATMSAFGFLGPVFYARWKRQPEVKVIDSKLGSQRQ